MLSSDLCQGPEARAAFCSKYKPVLKCQRKTTYQYKQFKRQCEEKASSIDKNIINYLDLDLTAV